VDVGFRLQLLEKARAARRGDRAQLAVGVSSLGDPGLGFAAE